MHQIFQSSRTNDQKPMANPVIYYVRHGQTDWNAELRFQGRRDIPLNSKGQQQADHNGETLAKLLPSGHSLPFISSPMKRTRETMERIRTKLGLPDDGYKTDDRLIEATYGDWEGKTLPEVKLEFPDLHRLRKQIRWDFCPPNGESCAMILGRIAEWYESLEGDAVVVAHGVVGRVLRYHLLDMDKQEAGGFVFPQDKICVIQKGSEEFV